jgi:hypothetical protein
VIKLRHQQPSLWHKGLAKDIEDLWEPWMKEVDQLLEDAALVEEVYEAQGKRHPKSQTRGRTQTPAEVALRLLILKHVRNWSYDTLEREVRANLVSTRGRRAKGKVGSFYLQPLSLVDVALLSPWNSKSKGHNKSRSFSYSPS